MNFNDVIRVHILVHRRPSRCRERDTAPAFCVLGDGGVDGDGVLLRLVPGHSHFVA
jgi:hypothetical protein